MTAHPYKLMLAATAVLALLVMLTAQAFNHPNSQTRTPAPTAAAGAAARTPELAREEGGTARQRLTLRQVIRAFADSYARYADGENVKPADAGITASAQVTQGGRLPARFRDGQLQLAKITQLRHTNFSAQATLLLANREQRFPMTIDILREQHGWVVEQLITPDFAADARLAAATQATSIPAAAKRVTDRFASAYVAFRAHRGREPQATAAITHAITAQTDPLAQTRLPATAHIASIAYGPLSNRELAATVTLAGAGRSADFSLLIEHTHTRKGWVCSAFL